MRQRRIVLYVLGGELLLELRRPPDFRPQGSCGGLRLSASVCSQGPGTVSWSLARGAWYPSGDHRLRDLPCWVFRRRRVLSKSLGLSRFPAAYCCLLASLMSW